MVHFCSQITLIRNFGAPFSWRPLLMAPPATPGQLGLRYATDKALPKTFENFSFQSLDIHHGDMVALNSSLAEIDWQVLFGHCNTEYDDLNENNELAELLRLTVLQLCNIHCPKKAPIVVKTSTSHNI